MAFVLPKEYIEHRGQTYRKLDTDHWRPATPEQLDLLARMKKAHEFQWFDDELELLRRLRATHE